MGGNIQFGSVTGKRKTMIELIRHFDAKKDSAVIHRVSTNMSMNGSIMPVLTKAANNTNSSNSVSDVVSTLVQVADAMGILNKALGSSAESVSETSNTSNTTAASNSSQNFAGAGVDGDWEIADRGASYSGIVSGVNTTNISKGFDMSSLDNMSQSLNINRNLSIKDLTEMKSSLSSKKVDLAAELSAAQADYSNIQGQMQTAQANVTRLEGAVDAAETERNDAKNNLDKNTSTLNSSIKARDHLDEQLGAVNDQYKIDCEAVKSKEQEKSSAQGEVSSAKNSKSQAESAVATAQQALTSAQNTLSSTPRTLPDGSQNPQYEIAQAAVERAKNQKEQADKSLKQAEQALEQAQQKLENAEQGLEEAQNTKHETLQNLQKTDSQYKNMAEKCKQMQNTVEKNQDFYDTSVETFEDTNANYERLNSELESQQSIVNQLGVYEAKIRNLNEANDKVRDIETKLNEKLQAKENMTNNMLENAASSEGCSAGKTPAENVLSMKDGPFKMNDYAYTAHYNGGNEFDDSQMKALQGREVIKEDSSFFEKSGCIANSDGSYTNSENGWTWIDMGNNTWVRTDALDHSAEYLDIAKEKYPDAYSAFQRSKEQSADYGAQGWMPNLNLDKWKHIYRNW